MSDRKLSRCYMTPEPNLAVFGVNREKDGYLLILWKHGDSSPLGTVKISDSEAEKLSNALVGKYEIYGE